MFYRCFGLNLNKPPVGPKKGGGGDWWACFRLKKKEGCVCLRSQGDRERKKEGEEAEERVKEVGVDEIIFWVWMNQLFCQ